MAPIVYAEPAPTNLATSDTPEQLIAERVFWHGNLFLRLYWSAWMRCYRIEIYRDNDRSTYDCWGIWAHDDGSDFAAARTKFEQINL